MSKTDWERVRQETAAQAPIPYDPADGPYDPGDESATEEFLASAIVRRRGQRGAQKSATKQLVSIRLSADVLQHFKATGPGWQTRIDEALKRAAGKH